MNRSRFEIIAEIIQNCHVPRPKTHIMYKSNMSFSQTNAYLNLLISLQLLSHEDRKYEATDRGVQFLSAYNNLNKLLSATNSPVKQNQVFSSLPALVQP